MMKNDGTSVGKANTLLGLQFLSDFGDQITSALLALCLLDITQSTGKVGLVYLITTVGYVIFTLAGGILGDNLSRRNILFCADLGRGLIVLLLIVAVHEKSLALIYATSFLLSILSSIHGPVKVSTWAESIPTNTLERYNSLSELSVQASTILGPLIASFFILGGLVSLGFAVDAMTFFLCAIIFTRVVSAKKPAASSAPKPKRDFLKGFKLMAQEPLINRYVAYDAIQMLGFGAFNATFLVLAQRDFGWSKVDYSYHLSVVALFTTLGALLSATRFSANMNSAHKLIGAALGSALALWAALKLQSFPISSIFIGICDGLSVSTMAVTKTRVQLTAKSLYQDYLSSIISARSIVIKGATLLGCGACLLIDDFISLESTLTLLVIPIVLSIMPIYFSQNQQTAYAKVKVTDS